MNDIEKNLCEYVSGRIVRLNKTDDAAVVKVWLMSLQNH